ncbi:MAG: immunoglobulin-like domain-containing protein [Jejuia sp.]
MKILKLVLIFTIFCSLFVRCNCSTDEIENDDEDPVIEIISPNNNAIFYPEGSNITPSTIIANARATDNNKIKNGLVTITNADGEVVHIHNESTFEVYTSFSTSEPGTYTVTFTFSDPNGNNTSVSRTVICEAVGDGTDLEN